MHLKYIILITLIALTYKYVNAACANAWAKCGGANYFGDRCCVSGYYCKYYNEWLSQCIPGNTATTSRVRTAGQPRTTVNSQPTYSNVNINVNNNSGPRNIFIAGDSTGDSTAGNGGKTVGWGKFLSDYVTCNVQNHAKSGRSARSFWREGRWTSLINSVQAGDYVFIQFGHNDGGGPNNEKERGCASGTGDETVTVKLSTGETEVVHTFPWYIRQMAKQVLAKNAHPILLTQTPRKIFTNGKIEEPGRFHDYMIMVAQELNIPCINMFKYIARQLEQLGESYLDSNGWFPADYLHPSPVAADYIAQLLVNAFSRCQPISELISVLNNKGKSVNFNCRQ